MIEPLGSDLGFERTVLKDATQCLCGKILLVGYLAFVDGALTKCPSCQLRSRVGTMSTWEAEEFLKRIAKVAFPEDGDE